MGDPGNASIVSGEKMTTAGFIPGDEGELALRAAVEAWARETAAVNDGLLRVGVPAHAAQETEQHGHLDVVIVVAATDAPPAERTQDWNLNAIPVATQALVYTAAEFGELIAQGSWMARRMREEMDWVYHR